MMMITQAKQWKSGQGTGRLVPPGSFVFVFVFAFVFAFAFVFVFEK